MKKKVYGFSQTATLSISRCDDGTYEIKQNIPANNSIYTILYLDKKSAVAICNAILKNKSIDITDSNAAFNGEFNVEVDDVLLQNNNNRCD